MHSRQTGRCKKKKTCGGGYGTRSPPRSGDCNHHCVPRLASYRSPSDPGSHELLVPPREGGGTTCRSSGNRGFTPSPRSEAAANRRRWRLITIYYTHTRVPMGGELTNTVLCTNESEYNPRQAAHKTWARSMPKQRNSLATYVPTT